MKICGCTSELDVAIAVAGGADAVGFIFSDSPRRITLDGAARAARAALPTTTLVGVFVNPTPSQLEAAARALPAMLPQFSGSESPELCRHLGRPYLKVLRVPQAAPSELEAALGAELERYPDALPILETSSGRPGGSGRTFEWSGVVRLVARAPTLISGGLNPDNVAHCVGLLHPYGVDVRSGVESAGLKDPSKVAAFVEAAQAQSAAP
ncbi:MAG: phosphoribosylanthranilate isomerase [Candidatus Dormibacteria bacterium]